MYIYIYILAYYQHTFIDSLIARREANIAFGPQPEAPEAPQERRMIIINMLVLLLLLLLLLCIFLLVL